MSEISVIGNDWSQLVPAANAQWTPSRTVSICIPARNPGAGLNRTLLALSKQTYPHKLFEVVITDDGSDQPVSVPDGLPYSCRVVRQEQLLAFGAGQARNTAARSADGEILMFLDGDVIPERQVVETYGRWFEQSELVVPMGLCSFVDTAELSEQQLIDLIAAGSMATHFSGSEVDDQRWRETTFLRTNDLRDEAIDAFRIVIGATFAVSRRQFDVVGGFRELGVRGVEDTEFGYRLHANGAILILDRDAIHWHQGRRNLSSDRRAEIDRVRLPYVQALIPIPGFRSHDYKPVEDIDAITAFKICPEDSAVSDGFDPTFATVFLPDELQWSEDAEKRVRLLFRENPVGVIRAISSLDGVGVVNIVRNRALRRAHCVRPNEESIAVAAELFGIWWVDVDTIGIVEKDLFCSGADRGADLLISSNRVKKAYLRLRWHARGVGASIYVGAFNQLKRWAQ